MREHWTPHCSIGRVYGPPETLMKLAFISPPFRFPSPEARPAPRGPAASGGVYIKILAPRPRAARPAAGCVVLGMPGRICGTQWCQSPGVFMRMPRLSLARALPTSRDQIVIPYRHRLCRFTVASLLVIFSTQLCSILNMRNFVYDYARNYVQNCT